LEFAREHTRAAALQARHRHLVIWFGEETGSYWVASSTGLVEVPDVEALERLLLPGPAHR
jgi:muconolactone delta-isomerase